MRVWSAALLCLGLASLGCEGPAGVTGLQGPQGMPGQPGENGNDGEPGQPGDEGPQGDPGKSAYLTGPGLKVVLEDIEIVEKKARVRFRLTDDTGIPLDREGKYTEGAVTLRFSLAWLDVTPDGAPGQYTSYTTRVQDSPITGDSAVQAAADEGGVFTEIDFSQGIYQYEFKTEINVTDATKTHTLHLWGTRTFDDVLYPVEHVEHFLPNGDAPTVLRDIVQTEACNHCHGPLKGHEGARRDVEGCITCHSPQSSDPDTGNTVEFMTMVHKIHRGKNLTSVKNGVPYQIIGFMQSVHDYSTVGYPQELQRCDGCHTGSQGNVWQQKPTRQICTTCHDGTSFEDVVPPGQTAHSGGAQPDDTKCTVCHPPVGGLAGIATKHLTPTFDPDAPKIEVAIISVENTAPGQTPEVVFSVQENGMPLDILAMPMTRFTVTVAGPTTDYASFWQNTAQGTGASGILTAENGNFRYTMSTAIPVMATGTYAVGIEAYNQPGGASGPRYSAQNPVAYVAVTDAQPQPRRDIVDNNLCNNCHYKLSAHGGQRNNTEYCVFCHNPNQVGDERIERFESKTVVPESADMRVFIHKIHTGEELAVKPYILGGFPAPTKANPAGTPIDFGEVRFPGDRSACWTCHKNESYMLPLPNGLLPTKFQTLACIEDPAADADAYCDQRVVQSESFLSPETAACTGCHNSKAAMAHAETNTTASGAEACATCHGPGKDFDVQRVHEPIP
ncbi:MAG: OmcA/MtrC family decaheme c-type cytochrome [Polyangiaceae bacterium]|nr:OmcA/MtrC family decaheme c-type cytochrome [Polyangiaceae bacterium]